MNRVRLNQGTERRTPSVWVGGAIAAQDDRKTLQAADGARSKNINTCSGEHHGLGRIASPRPRPNLAKLKTQLPAPCQAEAAQSSSAQTCSDSGFSSTSWHSEAPSSALTTSSTNATIPLSHLGSGNNSRMYQLCILELI